jgi:hypothetical protein
VADVPAAASDARDISRTNLFLAATLYPAGEGALPVKVRNLSPTGAMVEAATLPANGAAVRLRRGALHIAGGVVWSAGKRCGLAFRGTISVKDWMSPPANGDQQRVDAAVARLRSGSVPAVRDVVAPPSFSIAAELALVARLVDQLGDALAADDAVLQRHGVQLQSIDIVLQLLDATAGALAERPGCSRRLADLRASAEQALRSNAD